MTYPILVKRWTGDQAMTIVCEACHATAVIDPDDIQNEDIYPCPLDCGGWACMKYYEADECPGCGKLGFWSETHEALDGHCSRVCQLQAAYAADLASRKLTA